MIEAIKDNKPLFKE